ncbi:hypothetical protein Dimus_013302 [Dionaea muscipula]
MVGLYHSRAQSMDRDTPSSNSRTNPQEQPLTVNNITKTFGRRSTTPGFNKIHTKVGNTVNNHKENKLCEERNQERERDRRTEVRRRGRAESPLEGSRVRKKK